MLTLCMAFAETSADAAPISFAVQAPSSLTLSGSYFNGSSTFPFQQQAVGSLLTTGSGSFLVDLDAGFTQLQFVTGESVSANNANGGANFLPSSQPANWALQIITSAPNNGLFGAVRGATEEMSSSPIALSATSATSWDFDSTGIGVTMTGGTLFTQAMFSGAPVGGVTPFSFVGENGTNTPGSSTATLVKSVGLYTLTVPVDVTFSTTQSGQTFTFNLAGSVVATAIAPVDNLAVPEPGTALLLSFGLLLLRKRCLLHQAT